MGDRKLNDTEVLAIRTSSQTLRALAERYGVTNSLISKLQLGVVYKDSPGPTRKTRYARSEETERRMKPKPTPKQDLSLTEREATVISCLRFAEHLSVQEILRQSRRDRSGLGDAAEVDCVLATLHDRGLVERRSVKGSRGRLHRMTQAGLDACVAAGRPWEEADLVV